MVPADGTVIHHDVPSPQSHRVPLKHSQRRRLAAKHTQTDGSTQGYQRYQTPPVSQCFSIHFITGKITLYNTCVHFIYEDTVLLADSVMDRLVGGCVDTLQYFLNIM